MTSSIRIGGLADIDPVLRLWVRAGAQPSRTDDAGGLRDLIEHEGSVLLVAEDGAALVGSVIAGWDGWRGSVYRLVVDPTHRRRGLGDRLVAAAESHLHAVGAVRLAAVVVETDSLATAFWMVSGWERQDHRLRFVKD